MSELATAEQRSRTLETSLRRRIWKVIGGTRLEALVSLIRELYTGQRFALTLCVAGATLRSLAVYPVASITKYLFDDVLPAGDQREFIVLCGALLWLRAGVTLVSISVSRYANGVSREAVNRLRCSLIERLTVMSRSEMTATDPAKVQSIILTDTERVGDLSWAMINVALPTTITSVGVVVYLITTNPLLGIMTTLVVPLSLLVSQVMRPRVSEAARLQREQTWELNQQMLHATSYWDVISAQTTSVNTRARLKHRVERVTRSAAILDHASIRYQQAHTVTLAVVALGLLGIGGIAVEHGAMSLGSFLSFFVALSFAQSAATNLLAVLPTILTGRESLSALRSWRALPLRASYSGYRVPDPAGAVELHHVSFAYGRREVISNFNLSVAHREVVAVLGRNGSGKTTLAHLLMGWYRPTTGSLAVGGVPFDELCMDRWRRQAAFVAEDPKFLPVSIRDNLLLGGSATDDDIFAVGRIVDIDSILATLPGGLNHRMDNDAAMLTGGQRVRLAVVRALLRNPRLLVLDEPTNHLDVDEVHHLVSALRAGEEGPSIVIVTHDAAAIEALASRVVHLVTSSAAGGDEGDDPTVIDLTDGSNKIQPVGAASRA